jgi:lipopolysaccharide/colanic/teichoic acid biosynthesis glycosyltransferase
MGLLAIANKGNIFFLQLRPGFKSRPFKIIKFKTMRDEFDSNGNPLPDEERLTKIGQFVRSVSLDELLQLINVVKGDMSLVGPRPLLMHYLPRYSKEQARRHEVKSGITGWAQVNGRNAISWEKKFRLDVEYVDKQSFRLDCKILWMTFLNVIQRNGISADGHVTMGEFNPIPFNNIVNEVNREYLKIKYLLESFSGSKYDSSIVLVLFDNSVSRYDIKTGQIIVSFPTDFEITSFNNDDFIWQEWKCSLYHEMIHEFQFKVSPDISIIGKELFSKFQVNEYVAKTPHGFSMKGHNEIFYTSVEIFAKTMKIDPIDILTNPLRRI